MQVLRYTIIHPITQKENVIHIGHSTSGNTVIKFKEVILTIDEQQLAELGELFLHLAGDNYDKDSVSELLEGYFGEEI